MDYRQALKDSNHKTAFYLTFKIHPLQHSRKFHSKTLGNVMKKH